MHLKICSVIESKKKCCILLSQTQAINSLYFHRHAFLLEILTLNMALTFLVVKRNRKDQVRHVTSMPETIPLLFERTIGIRMLQ